ncbi:Zinc finger CCCH domain-containing protein 7 [Bienertia sinuspersici]
METTFVSLEPINDFTFVNSPPHHHQFQHHRDVIYRSPSRVLPPTDRLHHYDNHNHHENLVLDRPRFHLNELPPPPPPPAPSRVPPLSSIDRRSPTQFDRFSRQFDREGLNLEPRVRLEQHPDSFDFQLRQDRIDEDRRMMGAVDRFEGDFSRNWDHNRDLEHHERYYPEMVLRKDLETNSSNTEYDRVSFDDEVLIRGGRRDSSSNVGFEEIVNKRCDGGGREVSRSPIKFRIGGVEGDSRFGNHRGRKDDVQECNNRNITPRKNLQKKSAFLRIQPGKPQHHTNSNSRNRFDNSTITTSPHKSKESNNSEFVDNRISEERVGSPVELDWLRQSWLLPLRTRIDSESPSKVATPKMKSVVSSSIREDKDSKNRVRRVSPITKRIGNPNNVEARGSESSPAGSSSSSGGVTCKASSKGKVFGKDDKNVGVDKVSSPIIRKKRKAIGQLSRLSSSPMPSKTDSELVNLDSSANHVSDGSMPSDVSVKQSAIALSGIRDVVRSTQNEAVDRGKFDINESPTVDQEDIVGQYVSEDSAPKETREMGILESFPDSSGSLGSIAAEGYRNTKVSLQEEQRTLNFDEHVTNSAVKSSSDNHSGKDSVKDQDMAAVFVNNCSVEGSSELVRLSMGDNVIINDIYAGSVDAVSSVPITSFILNTTNYDSDKIKDEVDFMCPIVDGDEPCETQFSSPEIATTGLSLGGLYSDRKYEPELRHSQDNAVLVSFSNDADKTCETQVSSSPEIVSIGLSLGGLYSDRNHEKELEHSKDIAKIGNNGVSDGKSKTSCSYDDDVTTGSKNINTLSDVRVSNAIEEQKYQESGTMSGIHDSTLGRDVVPTTSVLPFAATEDSSLVSRKRKVGTEPDSSDSRVYESCHESSVSLSLPIENAILAVEKCSSAVSGPPFVETGVLSGSKYNGSCVKDMDSLNHVHDCDRIGYSSGSGKKRKVLPVKSVDAASSESSDLPASAMTLIPVTDGVSASSLQLAEEFELHKSVITGEDASGGATDSSCAEACSFADKSRSDLLFKDSCLSITESAPQDAEHSYLQESKCNYKIDENIVTAEDNDENGFIALESTCRMATSDENSNVPCLSADHTVDVGLGPLSMSMESDDTKNAMTDGNRSLLCLSTDCTGYVDQEPLVKSLECDESRIATSSGNSVLSCLLNDHSRDVDEGALVANMECDGNMSQNAESSSMSGQLQPYANSDILDTPSNVGPYGDSSLFFPTSDISNASPAIHVIPGEKLCMDDTESNQSSAIQSSISPQDNLLFESHKNNSKPGISSSLAVQPFTQKSVLLPSKNVQNAPSSLNYMSRLRKNVLTRSETTPSTSQCLALVNLSNKTHTYQAKPRTWHRTSNLAASNVPVKKPAVRTPHMPLYGKVLKVQDTSYIRKGNSLVRNPGSGAATSGSGVATSGSRAFGAATSGSRAFGAATSGSRAFGASIDRSKPNDSYKTRKSVGSVMPEPTELPDVLVTGVQSAPIEMPKTPPLPCSGKTPDNNVAYSGECTSFLPVDQFEGTDNEEAMRSSNSPLNSLRDPESAANRSLEDPGVSSDGDLLGSNSKRMVYIKRKSNQLVAASKSSQSSVYNMGKTAASSSDMNYYKRRKNQLIRASSDGNIQQMFTVFNDNSKSLSQRAPHAQSGRSFTKRLSNKVKSVKFSLVWKLGDSKSSSKGVDALRSGRLLSHLLPWKRATYWSRKLLSSRKRGAVYVRSGRGFSLRRSKVTSLPGTSLKWSKSMERRSKKVEEEAAQAVATLDSVPKSGSSGVSSKAASSLHSLHKVGHGLKLHPGERIFRIGVFRYRMDPSRRTLQRISDEEASGFTASKTEKDARKTYVPKRLLIGSDEYVRIGNGNQLVRDPKRRTRILAGEKVRWSLHTARMRLARKRKFCQFFTRFGKCNKGEGKCPFIHDPSKIAVCTKFLNGLCADLECKLTHKAIPERMPDCSFYLQGGFIVFKHSLGLCSNEKCPYRHVNVNPKASICESFLRGYCAEGNECRKKHSYICPVFDVSGSCPQGSKCKLYHPRKVKAKKRKISRDQNNAKGRYFGSDLSVFVDSESRPILEKTVELEPSKGNYAVQGDLGDFISLDVGDNEVLENELTSDQAFLCEDDPLNCQLDDLDDLIKPLSILGAL